MHNTANMPAAQVGEDDVAEVKWGKGGYPRVEVVLGTLHAEGKDLEEGVCRLAVGVVVGVKCQLRKQLVGGGGGVKGCKMRASSVIVFFFIVATVVNSNNTVQDFQRGWKPVYANTAHMCRQGPQGSVGLPYPPNPPPPPPARSLLMILDHKWLETWPPLGVGRKLKNASSVPPTAGDARSQRLKSSTRGDKCFHLPAVAKELLPFAPVPRDLGRAEATGDQRRGGCSVQDGCQGIRGRVSGGRQSTVEHKECERLTEN